ncbi:MAG: prepilin peptidase [Planctomycetota bacterium]|jgi:leader peptidase (prepilin peptidase)/N-methyltransferase|nr:prepilin peptidase [Planctomycetota bacterium]
MEYFFAFCFGAVLGSFLNVCIYRMPRELSLCRPPSRCSFCAQPVLWYDNIPIFSYLRLGGQCRYCRTFFSARYLGIEVLMGGLSVLCYHALVASHPLYPESLLDVDLVILFWYRYPYFVTAYFIGCVFLAALVIATFIDFDFQIIPDSITLGGLVVAILISLAFPYFHNNLRFRGSKDPLLDVILNAQVEKIAYASYLSWGPHIEALIKSLFGAVVGAATVWAVGVLGKVIFKKDAMGFGDVKFNAMIGAFLGWEVGLGTLLLGSVIGAIAGIAIILRTKQTRMPFGPYLSLAAALLFLYRDKIRMLVLLWMQFVTSMVDKVMG